MPVVVGIAFAPVTKIYFFDPAGIADLQPGDRVIVETSRGRTLGHVVLGPHEVSPNEITGSLKPVVRRATAWDLVQQDQMNHKAAETLALCRERARAAGLDIKIIRVEYAFDGSSLVVYFTAENRVDFRNLVHDLTQALHTRVEMRQVGVRDHAKFIGGYGKCGRPLCCSSWLREFAPVSIKMAKQQDLPLTTAEVSGVCGRLLCCLAYEYEYYAEARRQMPKVNSTVMTPQGPGKVKQVHVLRNAITVLVAGPNDTTTVVEMPVPEPVKAGDAGPTERRRPIISSEETTPVAEAVEEVIVEELEGTDEETTRPTPSASPAPPTGSAAAPAAQPATGQSRRSRSRRRRR